jgi:PAS domain S-box-containing protein
MPGETVQVELDKPAPDGNTRTTLWEFVCLTDAKGTASEIQCIGFDVTARKRAEKALEEANNLLERRVADRTAELERVKDRIEAIFNHSGDSLLLISVKDGIQQANYAFETLFGDTVDRYFGMSLSALVQPEEAAIIDRIVQEVAITHQTRQIETRSNRANGIVTDIELNIAPVNRSEQVVTSLVCIIHDISERKQIERIRRESEAMLQSVIENIPVQIFWKDQHSVYRGCNSLFARTVGLATPADIIGLTDNDLAPEHAEKWEMEDRDTMASGKPILNVEDFILQPDGSTRWLRSNKVALRDPNGNANGILVTIEDITASKQAELAIAEERNLLRTVIDTVPDYIYVKDNQHRMVLNNVSHARSLGGGTPRDITGKTDFDVFPAAMATKFYADEKQLFRTQSPILNTEERSIGQDGSEIWVLTTKVPLRNLNGEVVGLVGITHDVTSIKSSEETLRRSEQKLRESQKMLRLVLDTIPVRVFWKDRNSVLQGGNQLFARDAGFNTIEALLGKSEKDLPIIAIEETAYRSDDSAIMKTGIAQVEHEENLILPDHSKLVVQTSKLPLRNEQGEIIGILVVYVDISERKSAEQQLRYLASLQENMYDAVVSTDLDFRIQSWNRASERLYGWSANEVIGKNLIDVTNTVFIGESTIDAVNRLMQLGTWTGEVIQHHRDGTEVYILGSMVLHENEHRIPVGIIEVHRDISDRKKTETALEQAYQVQGQMQTYLKALHEITLILTRAETLDEFYRYVVEQGLTRFNFERMGLLLFDTKTGTAHGTYGTDEQGKVVDERHVTLDPGQINGVLPRILNRDEQFVFDPDAQLFDHDRYLRAGQNAVAALWDGAILGWISIDNGIQGIPIHKAQLDIFALYALTVGSLLARKIAELNLRMLAQRLELATRSADIGIWDWYIKSDRLIWDDRMFALYGISPEEFPGTTAIRKRVVHHDDVARLEAEIDAVIRREKDYDIEFRVIWPDGSEHYIKANALVLFASDGTAERMIGVNMDISELKQAEQVLRTALEKQTELSNLKTKFVSMASHEFRTPLAVILGTTETLSAYRAKLSEVQIDERLNKIKRQIGHMTNIMDDVLQLARLQAGKSLQFTPQSLDINALCLDIIEEFQSLPGNYDRLIYHSPMVTCVGQCDSQLMRQIISNLISNALKYSALDKAVTIALTKGKSDFTLVVRDQGIGIPPQDQSYLFEPFNRASNVGTISGTGLGLSITKQAIELHRGTIIVDSQLNIGTTFTITIPIALNKAEN